jgi:acetyl esterase/lipase
MTPSFRYLSATILLALLLAATGVAQAQDRSGVEARRDIVYATHDGERLLADWYGPSAPGSYPAVIAVHGGGWQAGDKTSYRFWGPYLAERGYVLMAIKYRFSKPGQRGFPQAVHDVRAAVQHAKHNAGELKINPDRIALMGDSAGGQLAALVALAGDHPVFAGAYQDDPYARLPTKVKALIGVYGIYDMAAQWNHDQMHRPLDQITEKFIGVKPMEDRKAYFDTSPLSYTTLSNNSTSVFLTWDPEDDIVDPESQSEAFLIALKQARFYVRTAISSGTPHFWITDPIEEADSRTNWLAPGLIRFLQERL